VSTVIEELNTGTRKIKVHYTGYAPYLRLEEISSGKWVQVNLGGGHAKTLGEALLKAGGVELADPTYTTDLPEARLSTQGYYVEAGDYDRSVNYEREDLLRHIKSLVAIHKFLVNKDKEEAEEKAKAAAESEAKRDAAILTARRDNLVKELNPGTWHSYNTLGDVGRNAIDRIIKLEDAASAKGQNAKPKLTWG